MFTLKSALATLLVAASTLTVAAFPDKPIRVVIGFPAGGPLDQHARLLTERLQAVLGQPIVIDYKSGAGGHQPRAQPGPAGRADGDGVRHQGL